MERGAQREQPRFSRFRRFAISLGGDWRPRCLWSCLRGHGEELVDEPVEVVKAEDSPTGKSIVRIPLDGVEKPVKNQRCYLEASDGVVTLLDSNGGIPTVIPKGEAITRIRFPAFWSTSYLMIEWENKNTPFLFNAKKGIVRLLRHLHY